MHLGGAWVVAITMTIFLRNREPHLRRLARSITLFNVILFSAGATFAIAGVLFFISLFPQFAADAFHIYWWPLFFEAITFALEIFFLYTFWFTWDKINPKLHLILAYGYAISVFFQVLLINTIAAGMLTPGANEITWGETGLLTMSSSVLMDWWNNATLWFLQFHRLAAAISYFGFLLAALAMFHFMDRKDESSKKYWDWVGSYGISWGLLGLVLQPAFGIMYMRGIRASQGEAFTMIMQGPRAWEMLLMVGLFSTLIITTIIYYIDRREQILTLYESRTIYALLKIFLFGAIVSALVLINPAWLGATYRYSPDAWTNPLGLMTYKYAALIFLSVIGSTMLTISVFVIADIHHGEWGKISRSARIAGILTAILGMWIVVTMGFVRESARSPWTIFNIIPVPGGQDYPTPVSIWNIFIVWIIILAMTLAIFWFTSKVTAEHPEEAEQV